MSTKTAPAPKANKRQSDLVNEYLDIEARMTELAEQLGTVKTKLVNSIGNGNSIEVADVARFTVTTQTSSNIDFDALSVARPVWARRVTKRVFDRAKFTHLRKAGQVPQDVLDMIEEHTSDPYLVVTIRPVKSGS